MYELKQELRNGAGQNYRAQSKGSSLQAEKTAANQRKAQPEILGEVNS